MAHWVAKLRQIACLRLANSRQFCPWVLPFQENHENLQICNEVAQTAETSLSLRHTFFGVSNRQCRCRAKGRILVQWFKCRLCPKFLKKNQKTALKVASSKTVELPSLVTRRCKQNMKSVFCCASWENSACIDFSNQASAASNNYQSPREISLWSETTIVLSN